MTAYRPKLGILRKIDLNNRGHYRYYSPYATRETAFKKNKSIRPKMPLWDLNQMPYIQTEKQLIRLIYEYFGEGDFRILAFVKGRKGAWTFWKGNINSEGFTSERKYSTYRKNIDKLKEEQAKAIDEEEKQFIQDEIDLEKECKEVQSYGMKGFLKKSIPQGNMLLWEEPDEGLINRAQEDEVWISNHLKKENDDGWDDDWGVKNPKKEEFEVW